MWCLYESKLKEEDLKKTVKLSYKDNWTDLH